MDFVNAFCTSFFAFVRFAFCDRYCAAVGHSIASQLSSGTRTARPVSGFTRATFFTTGVRALLRGAFFLRTGVRAFFRRAGARFLAVRRGVLPPSSCASARGR